MCKDDLRISRANGRKILTHFRSFTTGDGQAIVGRGGTFKLSDAFLMSIRIFRNISTEDNFREAFRKFCPSCLPCSLFQHKSL